MAELTDCPKCGRPMADRMPMCPRCRREALGLPTGRSKPKRSWSDRLRRKKKH